MVAQTPPTTRTDAPQPGTTRQDPPPNPPAPRSWVGLAFAAPFLVAYLVFLVWPTVWGLYSSFFNVSLSGATTEFLGLDNWREMANDPAVWDSLKNTFVFTLMSTPPLVLVGLGMALVADRARHLGWFLRFSFFAPFVLPATVVTLIWVWLYQPGFGLINSGLTALGAQEIGWISDERFAMLSVVITTTWWTVGFNFLLYLAALQGIPQSVYEAAAIDGCGGWQRLWRITLPLLRRTTALIVVLQLVASLKIFDQIYLMTVGGPNFATRPLIQYIYETGFTTFRIGYASSIAYMFFVVVVLVSLVQFRFFMAKDGDS